MRSRLTTWVAAILFIGSAAALVSSPAEALSTTCTWKGTTGNDTKTITAPGVYCAAAGNDTFNVNVAGTAASPVVIAPGNGASDVVNVNVTQTDNAGLVIAQPVGKTTTVTPAGGVTGAFRCVTNASYTPSATTNVLTIRTLGTANCVTAASSNVTVDNSGAIGYFSSLALDSSGRPVVSYYDGTDANLKVAHCGDANCSSGNTITTVDSSDNIVGYYTSLALDSAGYPVVSYYDNSSRDLKVAHCGDANCSANNTISIVDSAGNVGQYTSLALDSSGKPVISYYHVTSGDLKVVHCGNANCNAGNNALQVQISGNIGQYTSLALDSSGRPIISYYDVDNGDLKVLHCGDADCGALSTINTVDSSGNVGQYTSLVLDSSGKPIISYYDVTNGDLKVVHCGDADCTSANTTTTVDSTGNVGEYTSLQLDGNGYPVISYHDATNLDLKLVHCGNADCTSGNVAATVESTNNVGRYTSLKLDTAGNPAISSLDFTNDDLRLAHCGAANCR